MTFNEWWEEMQPILGNKSKADAKWAWNAALDVAAEECVYLEDERRILALKEE